MRAFAKAILEISLIATVILNIGICICECPCTCKLTARVLHPEMCVYAYDLELISDWSGAIIFLVIALISVLSYWFMRKR